jgi:hypothetical protein
MDRAIRVAELPMSRGAAWLVEGFHMFRRQPLAWVGLCVGWLVIWFGLLLVPLIGPVLSNLLQPVFFASFAVAAFKQAAGERITMGELFSGFRRNIRALVNLGLIMMLAQLASVFLMKALGLPSWPADQPFDLVAYAELLRESSWIVAAGFVVMALASGALWFAPQLVVFHDMTTSHAIRWSVYAALANFGAMLFYGALLVALLVVAWIPLGLGMLVMLPVMVISTYTGYRDVFEAKALPAPEAPPAA